VSEMLRIASWNMDHWKRMRDDPSGLTQRRAWDYLASLDVDVALVQEAVPPPFVDPATWPVRSHPRPDRPEDWFIGRTRRWGSGVIVFREAIQFEPIEGVPLGSGLPRDDGKLWISHPGTWAGVRLTLPDESTLILISGYGLMDDWNPEARVAYSTTTANRMLSDLTPLIDSGLGRRMIIAGDLNLGTQYTDPSPEQPHRWGPMHRATLARFEAFGFVDCLAQGVGLDRGPLAGCFCGPAPDCRHVRTYRHENKPDGHPGQADSFFATKLLAADLISCAPVDDEEAWALSDHCPIVAEFEVGQRSAIRWRQEMHV
jgi:hypothetical protein